MATVALVGLAADGAHVDPTADLMTATCVALPGVAPVLGDEAQGHLRPAWDVDHEVVAVGVVDVAELTVHGAPSGSLLRCKRSISAAISAPALTNERIGSALGFHHDSAHGQ